MKSQLLAIMTSYVTFLSPESEEGYITGYAKDQSNLVYDEILAQIDAATLLSGTYNSSYNRIKVNKNGSIIKALSRESRRFGDGTNPSFVVVDKICRLVWKHISEKQSKSVKANGELT